MQAQGSSLVLLPASGYGKTLSWGRDSLMFIFTELFCGQKVKKHERNVRDQQHSHQVDLNFMTSFTKRALVFFNEMAS